MRKNKEKEESDDVNKDPRNSSFIYAQRNIKSKKNQDSLDDLNQIRRSLTSGTDNDKLETLILIEKMPKNKKIAELLFNFLYSERYDRLIIKTIMILGSYKDKEILNKLQHYFSYQQYETIRLALIEILGKNNLYNNIDFIKEVAIRDQSALIRGMAVKSLLQKEQVDGHNILSFLMHLLLRERDVFPLQIALSVLPEYANEETISKLEVIYKRERRDIIIKQLENTIKKIEEKTQKKAVYLSEKREIDYAYDLKKKTKKSNKKNKDTYFLIP